MSSWPISIRYEGKPQGKGRPRFGKGQVYTPKKTKDFEIAIAWLGKQAMKGRKPLAGPVGMYFKFGFKSKDSSYYSTVKPDFDNLMKAVADSLNNIVYLDDCQVCSGSFVKLNSTANYIEVTLEPA